MTALDPRLDEIQARLDAAEKGPWFLDADGVSIYYVFHNGDTLDRDRLAESSGDDAILIANAPADLAYLLAELRKAHEALGVAFDYGWREGKGIPTPCDTLTGELFHDEAATAKFNPYRAAVAAAKGDERG